MRINIEPVRKKETANVIDFDYQIEDDAKNEYAALLSAERVGSVRISGSVSQKNGFAFIGYEIDAEFDAQCARCNNDAPQVLRIVGEKYFADKSDGKDGFDLNDDYYTLENPGVVDLRDFAAEFLSLEAPLRYLCGEDCKGLCQSCGNDLNSSECGCPQKPKNPAFKALDNFFD